MDTDCYESKNVCFISKNKFSDLPMRVYSLLKIYYK